MKIKKKGQVWVETVVYTLIALTVIGLFLSFARPEIEKIQDKSTIEQSTEMLEDINKVILNMVQGGAGNQRIVEIGIKKGTLQIDSLNDQLVFEMESRYEYTEPGETVEVGNLFVMTTDRGRIDTVKLISNYSDYNITYFGREEQRILGKSPTPYRIFISNKGGAETQIDFEVR